MADVGLFAGGFGDFALKLSQCAVIGRLGLTMLTTMMDFQMERRQLQGDVIPCSKFRRAELNGMHPETTPRVLGVFSCCMCFTLSLECFLFSLEKQPWLPVSRLETVGRQRLGDAGPHPSGRRSLFLWPRLKFCWM